MKRGPIEPDGLELTVVPHARRRGWETIRISFNWHDPRHARQAEAVLTALAKARREASVEQAAGRGEPHEPDEKARCAP